MPNLDRRHEQPDAWRSPPTTATSRPAAAPCPRQPLHSTPRRRFNTLTAPAVFTPGDNDWTDCDRNARRVNSLERLDFERSVFFTTATTTLGQQPDAPGGPGHAPYVENRRWTLRSRDLRDAERPGLVQQPLRHQPRTRPSRRRATRPTSPGCSRPSTRPRPALGGGHGHLPGRSPAGTTATRPARPMRDPKTLAERPTASPTASRTFLTELRDADDRLRAPGRRWVHGDSHYFRIDKPLLDADRPAAGELHARGDLRRPPGERQQRRPLAEGRMSTRRAARCSPTSRRSSRATGRPSRRRRRSTTSRRYCPPASGSRRRLRRRCSPTSGRTKRRHARPPP